jgi:hypothetical protein
MVEAVMVFGAMLIAFEFVLLSMVPPRFRLRLLGNKVMCNCVHVIVFALNLIVHWGTVTGTMSATGAFVGSLVAVEIAKLCYGTVVNNRRARRGIFGYRNEELTL